MKRGVIGWVGYLSLMLATPSFAATSPRLQPLERQLSSLAASLPSDVGMAALDLRTGETVSVRGDQAYPMASTVKVAIAANYLSQVEFGRRSLNDSISGRSAAALIDAMLIHSDNRATDLLLRNLGGPARLQEWLTQNSISGMRIDRSIARLLADKRDLYDVRDSSTPLAMVKLLHKIDSGALLRPTSRSYLLSVMARCQTGKNRMRALLPAGTLVQHKTGTLNGYASDVGFITLPDGRRIAIALFARTGSDRPSALARTARAIYDGFRSLLPTTYAGTMIGAN